MVLLYTHSCYPLALQSVKEAVLEDTRGNSKLAYCKYLGCMMFITQALKDEAWEKQDLSVLCEEGTFKLLKLTQQCLERITDLLNSLNQNREPLDSKDGNAPPPIDSTPPPPPLSPQPTSPRPPTQSYKNIISMLPTPPASNMNSRQTQRHSMFQAYQRRKTLSGNNIRQKFETTSYNLSLFREAAEKMALNQAKEKAFQARMEARQEAMQQEADKRWNSRVQRSDRDKDYRKQLLAKVLAFEEDMRWPMQLRDSLLLSNNDPEVIRKIVSTILLRKDHPLGKSLFELQKSIYEQIVAMMREERKPEDLLEQHTYLAPCDSVGLREQTTSLPARSTPEPTKYDNPPPKPTKYDNPPALQTEKETKDTSLEDEFDELENDMFSDSEEEGEEEGIPMVNVVSESFTQEKESDGENATVEPQDVTDPHYDSPSPGNLDSHYDVPKNTTGVAKTELDDTKFDIPVRPPRPPPRKDLLKPIAPPRKSPKRSSIKNIDPGVENVYENTKDDENQKNVSDENYYVSLEGENGPDEPTTLETNQDEMEDSEKYKSLENFKKSTENGEEDLDKYKSLQRFRKEQENEFYDTLWATNREHNAAGSSYDTLNSNNLSDNLADVKDKIDGGQGDIQEPIYEGLPAVSCCTPSAFRYYSVAGKMHIEGNNYGTRRITTEQAIDPHFAKSFHSVVQEITFGIDRLYSVLLLSYECLETPAGRDLAYATFENILFKPIWAWIVQMFRKMNASKEKRLGQVMKEYSTCEPQDVKVRSKFALIECASAPYKEAIDEMRLLLTLTCPLEKLECAVKCSKTICRCVEEYYATLERPSPAVGCDDLLPILSYVILKTNTPDIVSECHAMLEFVHEGYLMGEEGYSLTSVQAAISYLLTLYKQ